MAIEIPFLFMFLHLFSLVLQLFNQVMCPGFYIFLKKKASRPEEKNFATIIKINFVFAYKMRWKKYGDDSLLICDLSSLFIFQYSHKGRSNPFSLPKLWQTITNTNSNPNTHAQRLSCSRPVLSNLLITARKIGSGEGGKKGATLEL